MNMRERIRAAMDAAGLNMKELGQRAGLSETYVRDLLEGRSKDPKLSKILALAQALGKDLAWLIDGVEPSAIAEVMARLTPDAQKEVIDFARFKAADPSDKP